MVRRSIFIGFLLVLSACGSATSTASETNLTETGAAESDESSEEQSDEETNDGSDDLEDPWVEYESPIQDFLGVDNADFDSEDFQAQFVEEERAAQEGTATCMRELGWEYEPVNSSESSLSFETVDDEGLEYGSDEWIERYGLGISTQAFAQSQVGPGLVGYDDGSDQIADVQVDDSEDPNQDYVNGLSESEQQAYYTDLYGESPEIDGTLTEEEQQALWDNYEASGCYNDAYAEATGGIEQDFFEEFGSELEELYERVNADPRVVAEQQVFVDCIADAGHTITANEGPWEQFYKMFDDELQPIYDAQASASVDPFEGVDTDSMSEEEINEILESFNFAGPELTADQLATLAALQERERALAADVLACEPGWFTGASTSEIFFEVLTEYEQEFVDANAGRLGELEGSGSE